MVNKYLYDIGKTIQLINIANGWKVLNLKDWNDPYRIPTSLALLTSEVSEALEGFRNNDFTNFKEECADIFIRLLDLTHNMQIDLDDEVSKKLEKNRKRANKHGGKKV